MAHENASRLHAVRRLGLGAALAVALGTLVCFARRRLAQEQRPTRPRAPVRPARPAPTAPSRQILIPVANPATARPLVRLASALGGGDPPAELVALKVVTAPRGVPFEEARRYRQPMQEHYQDALAEAARSAREHGLPLRTEVRVGHEVAESILAFAESLPQPELVLLGWRGARASINQEVVSRAPVTVAVLRDRGLGEIRRVLVPVGWGRHARAGLRLAERLAQHGQARVTMLRVLRPAGEVDWESERAALVRLLEVEAPALRYDTELRLVRQGPVVPAILAEAARVAYDLIIVGATEEPWLHNWLFGAIPNRVAGRAPCSVLLVRGPLVPGGG